MQAVRQALVLVAGPALAAALAACGSPDPVGSPSEPRSSLMATTPSTPSSSEGFDPALAGVVQQARADLAARLDVPQSDISVVSAAAVTWPDAGLGCHRPGMQYAQVLTDGSRTILEHGGRQFAYHTGGRTAVPFLCEHPG